MTVTAGFPLKVAMRVLGSMVSTKFSALCAFGLRSKPTPRIVAHVMVLQLDVIMVDPMFLDTYDINVLFLSY